MSDPAPPSEQPPTRVERCPTCGSYGHVVTSDEGTSYFAPQQARVELAERISGWADDMEDSVPDQDDLRMIADLREAASTLTTYEQALEAADELARIANAHAHPQVVGAKYPLRAAYIAYRFTRTTTEGEGDGNSI